MSAFRRLITIALLAGTFSGLVWFGLQRLAVIPLIETAEKYETAAHESSHVDHEEDEGWRPATPWQRNLFTAVATVLSGIGFAAVLFGLVSLSGRHMDAKRGAAWGLAAFVCVALAPALGLPPQPPGVAVADLAARQLWWVATAVGTAAGLYLIAGQSRSWALKLAGVAILTFPHLIGAPVAAGENLVPAALVRQFATASLAASGAFWLTLGIVGGFLYSRYYCSLPRPSTFHTSST